MHHSKLVYIETFGCQMNERDSEIMEQLLSEASYAPTDTLSQADVVVVNTCSIRGKAEQKAFSLLGRLRKIKKKKPGMRIAVTGCVAQQEGKNIIERMPYVDIVLGPQSIYRLPDLINTPPNSENPFPQVHTDLQKSFTIPAYLPSVNKENGISSYKRFVTIMQGCNNFCTYCVVPYTRGREVSRKVDDIIEEVTHLVNNDIKEITLLGQNVNSYGLDFEKENRISFAQLLQAVAKVQGVERLRFTTSNPKDLSEELMQCFRDINILCPHFHLPVQSGSNNVLQRMNRKYTIETYLDKVARLREFCPEIAITTDIIVGFPGETEADFEATMDLLEKVRYHSAFSFKYSDRPNTKSASFTEKVPEDIKSKRLARLQKRQEQITLERNHEYAGKTLQVMVEGESKSGAGQISGRTGSNHIVNFTAPSPASYQPGQMLDVFIEEACLHSLRGKLVQ